MMHGTIRPFNYQQTTQSLETPLPFSKLAEAHGVDPLTWRFSSQAVNWGHLHAFIIVMQNSCVDVVSGPEIQLLNTDR